MDRDGIASTARSLPGAAGVAMPRSGTVLGAGTADWHPSAPAA